MRKIISIILAILIISMCSINVMAADVGSVLCGKTIYAVGDWVYSAINGGAYWEIDEYKGESEDITVPRIVNDKMVVSIGSYCFLNNTTVKNVTTSSPLWTVSEYAFLNCTSLESFECNFALKEIAVGAFSGTTALRNINLEDSVVTEIKPHSFMGSGIVSVKLPETCTKIDSYAFAQCGSLEWVTIPDSVTEIADTAFNSCGEDLTIICNSNSYAAQYAQSKGIKRAMPDNPLLGDSNGDGEVDILDVSYIQKYRIGDVELNDYQMKCADVNFDGKVTIRDATLVQMKLAHMPVNF